MLSFHLISNFTDKRLMLMHGSFYFLYKTKESHAIVKIRAIGFAIVLFFSSPIQETYFLYCI